MCVCGCVVGGVGGGGVGADICSIRLFRRSKSHSVELAILTAPTEYMRPHIFTRKETSDFQNFMFYS